MRAQLLLKGVVEPRNTHTFKAHTAKEELTRGDEEDGQRGEGSSRSCGVQNQDKREGQGLRGQE